MKSISPDDTCLLVIPIDGCRSTIVHANTVPPKEQANAPTFRDRPGDSCSNRNSKDMDGVPVNPSRSSQAQQRIPLGTLSLSLLIFIRTYYIYYILLHMLFCSLLILSSEVRTQLATSLVYMYPKRGGQGQHARDFLVESRMQMLKSLRGSNSINSLLFFWNAYIVLVMVLFMCNIL